MKDEFKIGDFVVVTALKMHSLLYAGRIASVHNSSHGMIFHTIDFFERSPRYEGRYLSRELELIDVDANNEFELVMYGMKK